MLIQKTVLWIALLNLTGFQVVQAQLCSTSGTSNNPPSTVTLQKGQNPVNIDWVGFNFNCPSFDGTSSITNQLQIYSAGSFNSLSSMSSAALPPGLSFNSGYTNPAFTLSPPLTASTQTFTLRFYANLYQVIHSRDIDGNIVSSTGYNFELTYSFTVDYVNNCQYFSYNLVPGSSTQSTFTVPLDIVCADCLTVNLGSIQIRDHSNSLTYFNNDLPFDVCGDQEYFADHDESLMQLVINEVDSATRSFHLIVKNNSTEVNVSDQNVTFILYSVEYATSSMFYSWQQRIIVEYCSLTEMNFGPPMPTELYYTIFEPIIIVTMPTFTYIPDYCVQEFIKDYEFFSSTRNQLLGDPPGFLEIDTTSFTIFSEDTITKDLIGDFVLTFYDYMIQVQNENITMSQTTDISIHILPCTLPTHSITANDQTPILIKVFDSEIVKSLNQYSYEPARCFHRKEKNVSIVYLPTNKVVSNPSFFEMIDLGDDNWQYRIQTDDTLSMGFLGEYTITITDSLVHNQTDVTFVSDVTEVSLTILPCTLDFVDFSPEMPSELFFIIGDPMITVPMSFYTWGLTRCRHDPSRTVEIMNIETNQTLSPYPDFFKVYQTQGDVKFTVFSNDTQSKGFVADYNITIVDKLYHYQNQTYTREDTKVIQLHFVDRCTLTYLLPSFEKIDMFHFINVEPFKKNDLYIFDHFKDYISEIWDLIYPELDPLYLGYTFCGPRNYTLPEVSDIRTGKPITYLDEDRVEQKRMWGDYLTIFNLTEEMTVEMDFVYDPDSSFLAGNHHINLTSYIVYSDFDLTNVPNATAQLNLNMYYFSDLEQIEEQTYTIGVDTVKEIYIPFPLIIADFPQGEFMKATFTMKNLVNMKAPIALPKFFAKYDGVNTLEVRTIDEQYKGENEIVVYYNFTKELKNYGFSQKFIIVVDGSLDTDPVKPVFDDAGGGTASINVGDPLDIVIPFGTHAEGLDFETKVELGSTSSFATYNEGSRLFSISAGTTKAAQIGSYTIKATLIDILGVKSSDWTYTIQINGQTEGGGKDSEKSAFVFDASKYKRNIPKDVEIKEIPAGVEIKKPEAKLSLIDQLGLIQIDFTNNMIALPDLLKTILEGESLTSSDSNNQEDSQQEDGENDEDDAEDDYRRYLQAQDIFQVKVLPGSESDPTKLEYKISLVSFTKKNLVMKLDFTNPLQISSNSEPDKVSIAFNSDDFFIDEYGQPLYGGKFLEKELPLQLPSAGEKAVLDAAKDGLGNGALALSFGNFILNFLLAGAMQYLWDLINSQQVVILLPLFNAQIPANSGIIFGAIMQIAAFDAIPTDPVYEWLELDGKDPINSNFEAVGFETILIMPNLGSLAIFIGITPFLYLLYHLLGCCKYSSKRAKEWRKKLKGSLFWGFILRLIMESYMIVIICCVINVMDLDFSDSWNYFNSTLSLVFLTILVSFPFVATIFLSYNWQWIHHEGFRKKYGELFEEYRLDKNDKSILIFFLIIYLRKIFMSIAVAVLTRVFFAQYMLLSFTSTAIVIAVGYIKPKVLAHENNKIIMNEAVLMILMYHIFCFTSFVPDPETRYLIGYSQIFFLLSSLFYNFLDILKQSIASMKRAFITSKFKKNALRYLEQNTRRRNKKGERRINGKKFNQRRTKFLDARKLENDQYVMDVIDHVVGLGKQRRLKRGKRPQTSESVHRQRQEILNNSHDFPYNWKIPENVSHYRNEDMIFSGKPSRVWKEEQTITSQPPDSSYAWKVVENVSSEIKEEQIYTGIPNSNWKEEQDVSNELPDFQISWSIPEHVSRNNLEASIAVFKPTPKKLSMFNKIAPAPLATVNENHTQKNSQMSSYNTTQVYEQSSQQSNRVPGNQQSSLPDIFASRPQLKVQHQRNQSTSLLLKDDVTFDGPADLEEAISLDMDRSVEPHQVDDLGLDLKSHQSEEEIGKQSQSDVQQTYESDLDSIDREKQRVKEATEVGNGQPIQLSGKDVYIMQEQFSIDIYDIMNLPGKYQKIEIIDTSDGEDEEDNFYLQNQTVLEGRTQNTIREDSAEDFDSDESSNSEESDESSEQSKLVISSESDDNLEVQKDEPNNLQLQDDEKQAQQDNLIQVLDQQRQKTEELKDEEEEQEGSDSDQNPDQSISSGIVVEKDAFANLQKKQHNEPRDFYSYAFADPFQMLNERPPDSQYSMEDEEDDEGDNQAIEISRNKIRLDSEF